MYVKILAQLTVIPAAHEVLEVLRSLLEADGQADGSAGSNGHVRSPLAIA
ncbi:MAG TPA: hypothetical protein VE199_01440 [Nitrososphaera sp.]|nr:hypothetical protein [Nitrososphaera sp.]